jgi:hypothetical protein
LPLADQRKWKIWIPPAVPGTDPYAPGVGDPTWEKSYKADGKIFKFTAVEDGGSVVGQRYSGPYQYDRCLVAIDSGVEEELPESAGWLADVNALCRVNRDIFARSRLVAAGTNLWVKKGSQWSIATHSPTVSPVLAVAENGILMGGHSIWRNGEEVQLDKLVENLKEGTVARYTNLRGYAMNAGGAIVSLADDALNPGTGKKTLLLLLPVNLDVNGAVIGGPIKLTLPNDNNGDKLADVWQRGEVQRWNQQFHLNQGDAAWVNPDDPSTWSPVFGPNGAEDAELADSDGDDGDDGPMPAMADKGDGLSALDEYRGYFLDGGPGITTPKHHRLSVARKNALFQFIVMPEITDGNTAGNFANPAAQAFDPAQRFQKVSTFFKTPS